MPNKDKRLQIRVSADELAGIGERARATGLTVAEYGRQLLLVGSIEPGLIQDALLVDVCDVEGVPPGVRCIKCGELH